MRDVLHGDIVDNLYPSFVPSQKRVHNFCKSVYFSLSISYTCRYHMEEYNYNLIISSHDPVAVAYNERIFSQNKSTSSHEYLFADGAKCSLSCSSLFKQASFFTRLEKAEWVRIFCIYIRTCLIAAPCYLSYSICLQTIEILP
jgi:hypothetical protein